MDAKLLRSVLPELAGFLKPFQSCFHDHRAAKSLLRYASGQLSDLPRKSVEPIALKAGVPSRALQEFLTHLEWIESPGPKRTEYTPIVWRSDRQLVAILLREIHQQRQYDDNDRDCCKNTA